MAFNQREFKFKTTELIEHPGGAGFSTCHGQGHKDVTYEILTRIHDAQEKESRARLINTRTL